MRFNSRNILIPLSAIFSVSHKVLLLRETYINGGKIGRYVKEIYEDRCEIEEEECTKSRRNRTCR